MNVLVAYCNYLDGNIGPRKRFVKSNRKKNEKDN